jgi:hypothetical protein
LFVGLIDAGLLSGDLGVDIGDAGFGLLDLGRGGVDLRPEVAIVEPHQHGARFDQLIVGHRDLDNGGADLGADRHGAGVDEGVVGRFIAAGVEPVGNGADDGGDDKRGDDQDGPPPPAHAIEERLGLAFFADRRFGVTCGGRLEAAFVVGALIHIRDKRPAGPPGFA